MPTALVVTKGAQGANARIKRAVWAGRGWRYAHEGAEVKHTKTAGGLTKSKLYKYPDQYEMRSGKRKLVKRGRVVIAAKRAAGKKLKRDFGADDF